MGKLTQVNPFDGKDYNLERLRAKNAGTVKDSDNNKTGNTSNKGLQCAVQKSSEDDFVETDILSDDFDMYIEEPGSAGASKAASYGQNLTSSLVSSVSDASEGAIQSAMLKNLSLDELTAKQTEQQAAVNSANTEVSNVQSGQNSVVKSAVQNEEKLKEAYENALKQDEEVSDKLKKDQAENQENISKKESQIQEKETAITEAEAQISNIDGQISSIDSQINALNASLNSLPAKTDENKEKHSEIDAMAAKIKNQIQTAEAQKKDLEKNKAKLENQIERDNKALEKYKEELKKFETKRDEIEKEIADSCSDKTKDALEKYQQARTNTEQVKASELTKAQNALSAAQKELENINNALNQLKAEQTQKENSLTNKGDEVINLAKQYDGLSADEMKQKMQDAGYQFDDYNWCADFVAFATAQTYGKDNTPGNYFNTCRNTASNSFVAAYPSYCPDVVQWGRNNGVWSTDASQVKPGDFILYANESGEAKHIGMVTSVNPDGSVNTIEGNTSDDNNNYNKGFVNEHHNVSNAMGYVLMSKLT